MQFDRTERGFKRYNFTDIYSEPCSLQESSLAERAAIWLGCERETVHEGSGRRCGARMHLDTELAARLIQLLQYFVDTGELPADVSYVPIKEDTFGRETR